MIRPKPISNLQLPEVFTEDSIRQYIQDVLSEGYNTSDQNPKDRFTLMLERVPSEYAYLLLEAHQIYETHHRPLWALEKYWTTLIKRWC